MRLEGTDHLALLADQDSAASALGAGCFAAKSAWILR
jgi:hypothetical protein